MPGRRLALVLSLALSMALPSYASATMYKCIVAGKTVYQDRSCPGERDSQPFKPKNPLNTIGSETLTGKPKVQRDDRPAWLKPMNPVEDCRAKGGKFDPEFRACMLP